uniref:Secreted protein n=1 Tax=Rhabditophanes sp. KR3021 TaxID=114890 RepID=A0AC35UFY1_9BILA
MAKFLLIAFFALIAMVAARDLRAVDCDCRCDGEGELLNGCGEGDGERIEIGENGVTKPGLIIENESTHLAVTEKSLKRDKRYYGCGGGCGPCVTKKPVTKTIKIYYGGCGG